MESRARDKIIRLVDKNSAAKTIGEKSRSIRQKCTII